MSIAPRSGTLRRFLNDVDFGTSHVEGFAAKGLNSCSPPAINVRFSGYITTDRPSCSGDT